MLLLFFALLKTMFSYEKQQYLTRDIEQSFNIFRTFNFAVFLFSFPPDQDLTKLMIKVNFFLCKDLHAYKRSFILYPGLFAFRFSCQLSLPIKFDYKIFLTIYPHHNHTLHNSIPVDYSYLHSTTSGNSHMFLTPVSMVVWTRPSAVIPRNKPRCESDCRVM